MNPFEFVIAIIAIVTIGKIIQTRQWAKYGGKRGRMPFSQLPGLKGLGSFGDDDERAIEDAETMRLREEVKALKERLQVLERITVDKENSLAREIDELRHR